ncbi:MAG: hypothetical protein KAG06_00730 [Methylococcales bacterium]|nr:hypothetical protein [Methylococcales bacterium]
MNEAELERHIQALTLLARTLSEPERTFKLNEVDLFKIQLNGLVLEDLSDNLAQMAPMNTNSIDRAITASLRATHNQAMALKTFDVGMSVLKTVLVASL